MEINVYCHLIITTKGAQKTLKEKYSNQLYQTIANIIEGKHSYAWQINGMEEHIHILCDLPISESAEDFVTAIKTLSSKWIKESEKFPDFTEWQAGYMMFTVSKNCINDEIEYIKNQKDHHQNESFLEEYKRLLKENSIEYEEADLF